MASSRTVVLNLPDVGTIPFNTVPQAVVNPPTIKLFSLQLYNCNFVAVMSDNE